MSDCSQVYKNEAEHKSKEVLKKVNEFLEIKKIENGELINRYFGGENVTANEEEKINRVTPFFFFFQLHFTSSHAGRKLFQSFDVWVSSVKKQEKVLKEYKKTSYLNSRHISIFFFFFILKILLY